MLSEKSDFLLHHCCCKSFAIEQRDCVCLQGERKISVLIGISLVFTLHVVGVYWWYWNDDLLSPLVMLPPKAIPPFWHAIFIIMVNGACESLNHSHGFCLLVEKVIYIGKERGLLV